MAKIKNLEINIKIGKKEYSFKNLILDSLLNNYAISLVDKNKYNSNFKTPGSCAIKFSAINDVNSDMKLKNNNFDICISNTSRISDTSKNNIINKYICDSEIAYIWDYSKQTAQNIKLKDYEGYKIYFLGFSYGWDPDNDTLAVLDVSNYDIYIQKGEEIQITRIDEISSDAIFTSLHEKINCPVHLLPLGIDGIIPEQKLVAQDGLNYITIYNNAYARLTNFGFGNKPDNIELEYDIEGNYEVNENIFSIKKIWSPKGLYPSQDLYPSDDLYPDDIPYEYLILKFKLFQKVAEDDATYEDVINDRKIVEKFTGAEYLQAIPLDKRGYVDLNIKYERG